MSALLLVDAQSLCTPPGGAAAVGSLEPNRERTPSRMFVAIRNSPRDYAWGSHTAIADFRGVEPSGSPEAEVWLGAHAGSPAEIADPASAGAADLAALIAADPDGTLGPALAREGARLPFL